jgi:hypothetical protein
MANAGSFTTGTGPRSGSANRAKQLSWGVGNYEFLDSEASKVNLYWRAIEYGSDVMVGRFLGGGWAGAGGGRGARHGQELTAFGEGSGQQFIPYSATMRTFEDALHSARAAREVMRAQGAHFGGRTGKVGKGNPGPSTLGLITKPIEAHEAYAKAFKEFDVVAQEREAIYAVFGTIVRQAQTRSAPQYKVGVANIPNFMTVSVLSSINLKKLANDMTSDAIGSFSERLTAVHRELAIRLQELVASNLVLVRPGVSSGQLRRAVLDPRNRFPQ